MKKAAGYIGPVKRKSEAEKRRREIEAYCVANDIAVVEWFGSESFGTVAFGDWMTGKRIDAVVVAEEWCVSDNVFEFYAYKSVLKRRHSDLVSVKKSGYSGYQLYENILDRFVSTLGRIELENAPIRKPHDRMDKAARGAYIGGRAPMGYRVESGKLVVNESEAPVVRFIMERKHSGATMLSTVSALNREGYRTRNGKEFVISTVQGIWNNEQFYRGYYRYGKDGEWVKGQHEAIIKE